MASTSKFAKLTSLYVIGEFLILAGGLISFPIFTRILEREEYGRMSLITTTLIFAEVIASAGLRHAAQRFYFAHEAAGTGSDFYGSVFYGSVLFGVLAAVGLSSAGWASAQLGWMTAGSARLLAVASCLIVVRTTTKILGCFYRVRERVKAFAVFSIAVKYAGMCLAILFVAKFRQGIDGFFWGLLAGELVVLAGVFLWAGNSFGFPQLRIRHGVLSEGLRFGFPLVVSSIGAYVLSMGDRFIVGHFMGPDSVAIYSVPYNLCSYVSALMLASYEFAFVPVIMERWEHGSPDEVRRLTENVIKLYSVVALPVIFGLSAVGPTLLAIVASDKYTVASSILPYVVTGEVLKGLFTPLTIGLQFKRRTAVIAKVTWGCAGLNILLNLWLVPWIGLKGAAVATLASYLAVLFLGGALAFRCFRFSVAWAEIGTYVIASVVMFGAMRGASAVWGEQHLFVPIAVGVAVFVGGLLAVNGEARQLSWRLVRRIQA